MSTDEIIDEVTSLPVDVRLKIVDALLKSLNTPDPSAEQKWTEVAQRRVDELDSGLVEPVPGDQVFARIRQRFGHP